MKHFSPSLLVKLPLATRIILLDKNKCFFLSSLLSYPSTTHKQNQQFLELSTFNSIFNNTSATNQNRVHPLSVKWAKHWIKGMKDDELYLHQCLSTCPCVQSILTREVIASLALSLHSCSRPISGSRWVRALTVNALAHEWVQRDERVLHNRRGRIPSSMQVVRSAVEKRVMPELWVRGHIKRLWPQNCLNFEKFCWWKVFKALFPSPWFLPNVSP